MLSSLWRFWIHPWATVAKIVFILGATGMLGLWIGLADANSALTFGGRLQGIVLFGASAVVIAAAAATPLHQTGLARASSVMITGAMVATLVVGVLLVVDLFQPFRRTGLLYLGVALLLLVAWTVSRAHRAGARVPYPKSIAITAVVPLLLALVNLVYTDVYLPSSGPQGATLTATVAKASRSADGAWAYVPVTLELKNTSTHKTFVLVTEYSVVTVKEGGGGGYSEERLRAAFESKRYYSAGVDTAEYTLLQTGRLVAFTTLEPGEGRSATRLVPVRLPVSAQSIAVFANAVVIRADQATVSPAFENAPHYSWKKDQSPAPPNWVDDRTTDEARSDVVTFQAPLTEASRLSQVLNRRQYITAWLVLRPPTAASPQGSYLQATISSRAHDPPEPSSADFARLARRYGFQRPVLFAAQTPVQDLDLGPPAALSDRPSTAGAPVASTLGPTGTGAFGDAAGAVTAGRAENASGNGALPFTGSQVGRWMLDAVALVALGMVLLQAASVTAHSHGRALSTENRVRET